MIGYTRREASLARFLFSTLLSAESERSMLIGYLFYQRRHETSPSPSLSISGCNFISRFGTFAFRDRKAALSSFSSMLWYYSCEITNKKIHILRHEPKWIVNFINIKSSPSSHFHLKIWRAATGQDTKEISITLHSLWSESLIWDQ